MKRCVIYSVVSLILIGTVGAEDPVGLRAEVTLGEFEDLSHRTDDLILNNFTIYEDDDDWFGPDGWNTLRIKLSGKNRTDDTLHVQLQIIGLDEEGRVLWCTVATPMMGMLSGKTLEELTGSAWIAPGTLDATAKFVVLFSGELGDD